MATMLPGDQSTHQADRNLLQTISKQNRVHEFAFKPYEELKEWEEKRVKRDIRSFIRPNTIGYFEFNKFLQEHRNSEFLAKIFNDIAEYRNMASFNERRERSLELFEDLVNHHNVRLRRRSSMGLISPEDAQNLSEQVVVTSPKVVRQNAEQMRKEALERKRMDDETPVVPRASKPHDPKMPSASLQISLALPETRLEDEKSHSDSENREEVPVMPEIKEEDENEESGAEADSRVKSTATTEGSNGTDGQPAENGQPLLNEDEEKLQREAEEEGKHSKRKQDLLDESTAAPAPAPFVEDESDMDDITAEIPDNVFHEIQAIMVQGDAPRDLFKPLLRNLGAKLVHLLPEFYESKHYKRYVQAKFYINRSVNIEDFRLLRVLGRGAFGMVSAYQKIDTRHVFAVKAMNKKMIKMQDSEWMVINERNILHAMDSPFVLKLSYSFHDKHQLYLLFDLCIGGDLKFHLRKKYPYYFKPNRAKFYAAEVLLGLEHIHSKSICYRDLKPSNIMLDSEGHVKISDLGLAVKLREDKLMKHLAGTAGYWAPEIISKTGTYFCSDFWSFAVFLYEMTTGARPQCKCRDHYRLKHWCPFGYRRVEEENAVRRHDGKLIISIRYDHIKDPILVDLLKQLFVVDPTKRLGYESVDELKNHAYFRDINWTKLARREIPPPYVPDPHVVPFESVEKVGEWSRQSDFVDIPWTKGDDLYYETFEYTNRTLAELQLTDALTRLDKLGPRTEEEDRAEQHMIHKEKTCCTVL